MIRRILLPLLLIVCCTVQSAQAQDWQRLILSDDNFYSIQKKAGQLFENYKVSDSSLDDDDYIQYKRWEWFWSQRIDSAGHFPNLAHNLEIYNRLQKQSPTLRGKQPQWHNISQTNCTGGYNGMGRTTCVAFDPIDSNTFYVGAPNGGLWKTTDGGSSYVPLTEMMPYVSVGQCVVDPTNRNTLYITVGDAPGWWIHTLGVYKSINGGKSWYPTGLNYTLANGPSFRQLIINPLNPKTLFAATYSGLFVTRDSGHTWSTISTAAYSDLKIKYGDTTTLYAATDDYWGYSNIYISKNGGNTFSQLTHFPFHYNYIVLANTQAAPGMIAAMCSHDTAQTLYISHNSGDTFYNYAHVPENSILYISPNDSNMVYVGYTKVWQSTDGGKSFTQKTMWYQMKGFATVHADHHNVAHNPHNPDHLYFSCDGGLYRYSEKSDQWKELSNGLIITQFYCIASSPQDTNFIIGGTQDNGGRARTAGGKWRSTNGGDAMIQAIDPTDDNIIYTTYIYGNLYRSDDQGIKIYSTISDSIPGGRPIGAWVTPYVLDPSNHNAIIAAYDDVYRSTNRGNAWSRLSHKLTGDTNQALSTLAVAPSDSNTIYTSYGNVLYVTRNLGATWTKHNAPFGQTISSIAINPTDPRKIWISCSGYGAGYKVFTSSNAGISWHNMSDSIPNISANTLIYLDNYKGLLFCGTDIGVFYRDSTMNYWQRYGTGLPNTIVTWFNALSNGNVLRAATYGRGIWQIQLPQKSSTAEIISITNEHNVFVFPNPGNNVLNIKSDALGKLKHISLINLLGQEMVYSNLSPIQNALQINVSNLTKGTYMVRCIFDDGSQINAKWTKQ